MSLQQSFKNLVSIGAKMLFLRDEGYNFVEGKPGNGQATHGLASVTIEANGYDSIQVCTFSLQITPMAIDPWVQVG